MKVRVVLSVLALVLSGQLVAAGDEATPLAGAGVLSQLKGKPCHVGDVRPVLALTPAPDTFRRFLFEGVAVAPGGVVYTQEQCTGDVYRIDRHGAASVIGTIDYGNPNDSECNQAGGLGLALGAHGDLWVAVISWVPESHGVWRVGRDGSVELAVPMSFEEAPVPNGLTFDSRGNLYVTESILGGIWKVEPGAGEATLWLEDELLAPSGGPWTGFGANGITFRHRSLYVANTDRGIVLRIPIRRDGSPGEPTVISSGLVGPDGLAFDAFGQLFAVTAYGGEVVRIRRGREPEVVVDLRAAGVDLPASLDFKRNPQGADTAYITNFDPLEGQPNLVKVNLCQKRPCRGR